MSKTSELTLQEQNNLAEAIGVIQGCLELFIEGRLPTMEAFNRAAKAFELIESFKLSKEELGSYFVEFFEEHQIEGITDLLNFRGLF